MFLKGKLIAVAGAIVFAILPSFADVYFVVGTKGSSWQDVNNYRLSSRTGSIPSRLPEAADHVITGAANSLSTNDVEITAKDRGLLY